MLFQLVENISITNIVSVEFHMARKGDQSVFAFEPIIESLSYLVLVDGIMNAFDKV